MPEVQISPINLSLGILRTRFYTMFVIVSLISRLPQTFFLVHCFETFATNVIVRRKRSEKRVCFGRKYFERTLGRTGDSTRVEYGRKK